MRFANASEASEIVAALLKGAQLDTLRVYSLIIQLGFFRPNAKENSPREIWLSASGSLDIVEGDTSFGSVAFEKDFFLKRVTALGVLYKLIGQKVSTVNISESGILRISIGDVEIQAGFDDEVNFEEIWSVMTEAPDVTADQKLRVTLDDSGKIYVFGAYHGA